MDQQPSKQATKLKNWCRTNDIGTTTAYELIKTGKLKIVKLGRSSYVLQSESERFFSSLSGQAA